MQEQPKTLNQRKTAERKWPIEAASIRDALMMMNNIVNKEKKKQTQT